MMLIPHGPYRIVLHDGTVLDGDVTNTYHMDDQDELHLVFADGSYQIVDAGKIAHLVDQAGHVQTMHGVRLTSLQDLSPDDVAAIYAAYCRRFPYAAPGGVYSVNTAIPDTELTPPVSTREPLNELAPVDLSSESTKAGAGKIQAASRADLDQPQTP